MAFESLQKIVKPVGRSIVVPNKIGFATDVGGRGKNSGRFSLRITIPESAAKEIRFIKGDRMDILVDKESRMVLVKRVSQGGWMLSSANKNTRVLNVKITWAPGMPSVATTVYCDYIIDERGLVFELPDEVSFGDDCARRETDD